MIRVRARVNRGIPLDKLHRDVLAAMEAALAAAEPATIIRRHLRLRREVIYADKLRFPLKNYLRIFVIGGGKASGYMAEEVERLLGKRITSGLVTIPDYLKPRPQSRRIKYHPATHPVPTRKGLQGVLSMLELVKNVSQSDLVIVLLSGGGSALMPLPARGTSLQDEGQVTSLLLKSGASIQEINAVRKHLSQIKGGRLAERLYPATVLSLIISDVVGDRLDAIASGPTTPDTTTYSDAEKVLVKYDLWSRIPASARKVIKEGLGGSIADTPKKGDRAFRLAHNLIVGSNGESCFTAAAAMRKAGYSTLTLSTQITGEAREVGRILGSIINDAKNHGLPIPPPAALVVGGETTVAVRGKGKGGRNQELALAAAITMSGSKRVAMASLATDGVDGQTDAAGAIADGTTVARGRELRMDPDDYLNNNNCYSYFLKLGDLIRTGPTGTNVNDVMVLAAD